MENYIAEIRLFPYNNIPTSDGWMPCNGQTMQLQNYQALYSLLGIAFGGDGRTTFMLPNLNGRTTVSSGISPLSNTYYKLGNPGGLEKVQLVAGNLPIHNHIAYAQNSYDTAIPTANFIGNPNVKTSSTQAGSNAFNSFFYKELTQGEPLVPLKSDSITPTGSSQAHENRQPFLTLIYCIATTGLYPMRP